MFNFLFFKKVEKKESYYKCNKCKNIFESCILYKSIQYDFDGFEDVQYYDGCPRCKSEKISLEYGDIVMAKLREGCE